MVRAQHGPVQGGEPQVRGKESARRSGNYPRHASFTGRDARIIHDFDLGALAGGLSMAVSFGLMALHWAVM